MYTGLGQSSEDRVFGTWHVDANGQVSNGPLQMRSPNDPPYLPALRDLAGNRLWWTLKEIITLPQAQKSFQSDISTWELQKLVDAGRGEDIWPVGEGPWAGRYTGGVSPWGISSGSFDAPWGDPYFAQAQRYSTQLMTTGTGDAPTPGAEAETPFMQPRDPATIPGYPVEFGGPQPAPTVSPVPPVFTPVIPADTIVPSSGQPQPVYMTPSADVVSPMTGTGVVPAGTEFPFWVWIALGIGAYAVLSRK